MFGKALGSQELPTIQVWRNPAAANRTSQKQLEVAITFLLPPLRAGTCRGTV